MAYFIYRVSPLRTLVMIGETESYRDAKRRVRELRQRQPATDADTIRMVFAADESEAERLLSAHRERTPSEDD